MFVDASALLAILLDESDRPRFAVAIDQAQPVYTSPIAVFEAVAGLMRVKQLSRAVGERAVRALLTAGGIDVVPITDDIGHAALDAFERYGKGRGHPAQLNLGDCFAYAVAQAHGLPILFKGDDFSQTDATAAV